VEELKKIHTRIKIHEMSCLGSGGTWGGGGEYSVKFNYLAL